ncbi:hypothetical protein glysoja_009482 [Glycine soja]|nr:hypothetical protein glysoja_009482 [Glycine soja]
MAGRKHAPSSFTRLDETRLAHSSSSAAVVRALEERVEFDSDFGDYAKTTVVALAAFVCHFFTILINIPTASELHMTVFSHNTIVVARKHHFRRMERRNAIEFEKKTHARNLEHRRAMDNNMIIMDREVEKLRADLANAEKRARAVMAADAKTNPGYPANYDNPEMGYGGITCPPDSYSMHQLQAVVDTHSPHEAGASLHYPNDLQHTQVPR